MHKLKNFTGKTALLALILFAGNLRAFEFDLEFDFSNDEGMPAAIIKAADDAYEMNTRGLEALEQGNYSTAMSFFDEALRIFPLYSDAMNNRGVVYFRRGDVAGAQKVWADLISRDSDYAVAYYNLGFLALHEKKHELAKEYLEEALRLNRRFTEAMVRLGLVHLQLGENSQAISRLQRAYRISPDLQDVWNFYSYALIVTGDTSRAVNVLKSVGDHKEALAQLGRIEGARGDFDKALHYLSQAVKVGADRLVLLELAIAHMEAGDCSGALETLEDYFSNNQTPSADAFLFAGISAKECGNLPGARDYFEQGISFYPEDPLLRYNLGQLYFNDQKFAQAEAVWDGLSDSLQEPSLYYMRALNANRLGEHEVAKELVEKAIKMDRRADFYDLLGVIYHNMGDSVRAAENFTTALEIDPDLRTAQLNLALRTKSPEDIASAVSDLESELEKCSGRECADYLFELAIMQYIAGDPSEAINILESIPQEHKSERIYRHLGIFYREQHNMQRAIEVLQKAIARFVVEVRTEYELAETYLMAGYPSRAAELIKEIIPRWRENPWRLYYQLGYAYLEQNDLRSAREAFERSLNASRNNVAARGLLAFVLNRKGKVDEARLLWERNLRDDPDNPVLWINMGLSYESEGRFSDALGYYQRALMQQPDNSGLHINIGNVYMGMEKYREAFHAYSRALESEKRDLAAYNIFLLSQRQNQKYRAKEMLEILRDEYASSIHTRRAQAEMDHWQGDTVGALNILESLEEKDYYDWFALARIYASRGEREKAQHALSNLPEDAQWDRKKTWVMASIAFHTGDYHRAISLFQETGDTSFAARYNVALSAFNGEMYQEALSMAEVLVREAVAGDRADVCRLAGNAASALELWGKARIWYRQLLNMEPKNPIVLYNLAVAHYNLDEVEQAYIYYQRARELDDSIENRDIENRYLYVTDPQRSAAGETADLDSVDLMYNRAVELQKSGEDSLAEELYLQVVKQNPRYSLAWNNLGTIYGARGEIDKAEAAYLKALERRFDLPDTYANLVNLYIAIENYREARRWSLVGLGHNPDCETLQELEQKAYQLLQETSAPGDS
ncbi:Uncharacterized protein CHISP_2687 [Chitinispirillum alkaliphilum]|nr:Uncharacterized protein CHISP_2687 [Chitinispirillum alkaliphilum]